LMKRWISTIAPASTPRVGSSKITSSGFRVPDDVAHGRVASSYGPACSCRPTSPP
jgi:hypothetical protein